MNKQRRARLQDAVKYLTQAEAIVERVCAEEEDCMDNIPENLQVTDKLELMEDAVENLNDAAEHIDEAKIKIESAMR